MEANRFEVVKHMIAEDGQTQNSYVRPVNGYVNTSVKWRECDHVALFDHKKKTYNCIDVPRGCQHPNCDCEELWFKFKI